MNAVIFTYLMSAVVHYITRIIDLENPFSVRRVDRRMAKFNSTNVNVSRHESLDYLRALQGNH